MIEITDFGKDYGDFTAVDSLNLLHEVFPPTGKLRPD